MCYHTSRGYCCPTEKTAGRLPAFGHGVQVTRGGRSPIEGPPGPPGARRRGGRSPAVTAGGPGRRRRPASAHSERLQPGRAQGDRPAAAAPMIAQAPRRARCGAPRPRPAGRPAAPGRAAARAAALRPGRGAPQTARPPCPRHPRRPAPGIPVNRLNCHRNIPEYARYLRTNFPAVRNPVLTLRDDRAARRPAVPRRPATPDRGRRGSEPPPDRAAPRQSLAVPGAPHPAPVRPPLVAQWIDVTSLSFLVKRRDIDHIDLGRRGWWDSPGARVPGADGGWPRV